MVASTTPGTHNPRNSAQTMTNRLREIGEIPQYTLYVLYAAFLFWPSIYDRRIPQLKKKTDQPEWGFDRSVQVIRNDEYNINDVMCTQPDEIPLLIQCLLLSWPNKKE